MSKVQEKPDFGKLVQEQLVGMKKRTSQLKGELNDGLTEVIADNFKGFFQISQQLVAQLDQKDKQIEALQKTLDDIYQGHPEIKIALEKKTELTPKKTINASDKLK